MPRASLDDQHTEAFVTALARLSIQHGIGIGGRPVLFVMEREDNERSYHVNDASDLTFE